MTDYLALAMEQGENISSAEEDVSLSTEVVEGLIPTEGRGKPGGHLFRVEKTPPRPPEKTPRGGRFDSPSPWNPIPNDQGRGAAAPLALEPSPGRPNVAGMPRSPHFVAETGEGEPAAEPEWLHMAGVSRSAAVYDALLSGSGSGADGAILTSLISRKQEGQKGFLGGSGGPFFGLSKNGPPGSFASAMGQREQTARDPAVLPLLRQVRQAQRSSGFVQSQRRAFTVTLPEGGGGPALSAEDFDLACERDARRYGGGFGLY